MTRVNENLAQFGTFIGKVGYVVTAPIIGLGRLAFAGAHGIKHAVYQKVADKAIQEFDKQQANRSVERNNKVNQIDQKVKKANGFKANIKARLNQVKTRVQEKVGNATDSFDAVMNDVAVVAGKKLQGIVDAELKDQAIRGGIELIPFIGGAYYAFIYEPKTDIFSPLGKDDFLGYSRLKNIREAESMIDEGIKQFVEGYNPCF